MGSARAPQDLQLLRVKELPGNALVQGLPSLRREFQPVTPPPHAFGHVLAAAGPAKPRACRQKVEAIGAYSVLPARRGSLRARRACVRYVDSTRDLHTAR
jgi:hypothetical protein